MKQKVLIGLLLVCSTMIAQNSEEKFKIAKNQWIVGGSLNVSFGDSESEYNTSIDKFNSSTFGIKPEVSYSINKNLIIGLITGYSISENENETDNYEWKNQTISLSSYIRKYFAVSNKFAFNIQGELTFSKDDYEYKNSNNALNNNDDGSNSFFIGLRPGITYSLTNKIYLQANLGALGYSKRKNEQKQGRSGESNSFAFNLSTSNLSFGVLFVL